MTGVELVEEVIVALFLGEICEEEAIALITDTTNVTELGARDLLWGRDAPSARYGCVPWL